jgi:hypothetical protein
MRCLLLAVTLLVPAGAAFGQRPDACPMRIQISNTGIFYTNRFSGHYRTSSKLLESDLQAGCYNDSNPTKVTSVTVSIALGAPAKSIEALYGILDRNGWPKSKIKVQP